ncbi:hypothetical protein SPF06_21750 [Sinomonas sp. JGH33]|uniref:Uncharacterized protein n=1 Tax=Sinomonas terricola TaxID=3110330 RepID=A0ABU5TCE7_9MICC|nr:hypothetical protein [Sinomonas sp. JGH33]MEA5457348.1 hypothetical protein [Sinomonas sp. JGH33]
MSSQLERNEGHTESADMLADGVVDKADYDRAFNNLVTCMREGGYDVSTPAINPADGLTFLFEYRTQGRDLHAMNDHSLACETKYWGAVSASYAATNEQRMDEPVRSSVQVCMKNLGYDVPDDARSFRAIAGDPIDEGTRDRYATECLGEAITRLHPEIKSFGISG